MAKEIKFSWAIWLLIAVGLYLSRAALTPFVLAGIFAYLLNPIVNLIVTRLHLHRSMAVGVLYLILIGGVTAILLNLGLALTDESEAFSREARVFLTQANSQLSLLPAMVAPIIADILESVRATLSFSSHRVATFLPGALNRTVSLLVFLVASFYLLRDGHVFIKTVLGFFAKSTATKLTDILEKINTVMGNYLRGQLFLVVLMAIFTYLGLILIGVRYALILSIFTGFAEVIPFIGPIVAAAVAVVIAFTDGYSRFGTPAIIDAVAVIGLYTVLRQLEDLFVIPQIMGRLTKLHPLVVLFVVLVGGYLFGVVGYLLAVPVTASLKVIFDYLRAN